SNAQRKLYFTYNGGPVFRLDLAQVAAQNAQARAAQDLAAQTAPQADSGGPAKTVEASADTDEPKDAAGYRRRAAAFRARLNFPAAIADLTKAIELDPSAAEDYVQRAQA